MYARAGLFLGIRAKPAQLTLFFIFVLEVSLPLFSCASYGERLALGVSWLPFHGSTLQMFGLKFFPPPEAGRTCASELCS
jgi:hypothetical protein